jgi:hypothetical protein
MNAIEHTPGLAAAGPLPGAPAAGGANPRGRESEGIAIPELVGQVFEAAPAIERSRLLEQLMRPLGVLSLVAIAGGVFASLRFRGGWQDFHVRLDDAQRINASDVIALVDHVQQVSVEAVDGLAQTLAASPIMAGSAAAALLVTVLLQRARSRRERGDSPARVDRG